MDTNINIKAENVCTAYKNANEEQKTLLENLFGQELFRPKDIKERIKTFEDACSELGSEHPLVVEYGAITERVGGLSDDHIAYLKLRIIAAALNEGWEPDWADTDEYKYYPWFRILSKEEYGLLSDDKRKKCCRVVGRASLSENAYGCLALSFAYGGLVYSSANHVSTYSNTYDGSRLAFKTRELAEYAGQQFIELWRDFLCK